MSQLNISQEIKNSVYGIALAESLTASSAYHRRLLIRPSLGEKIRDHLSFAELHSQTNIISAFTLPRNSAALAPAPSDDAEWFTFSALAAMSGNIINAWNELAQVNSTIKARAGTKIALGNRQAGNINFSGYDNPLYFDDIAGIRAIAIALTNHGCSEQAELDVLTDASITHAADGIWFAQAIGKLTWLLLNGVDRKTALITSLDHVQKSSWTSNLISTAIAKTEGISNTFERVLILDQEIVDRVPSHPNSAPETMAALYSHALNSTSADQFIASAFMHDRMLDSLPALHGGLAHLLFQENWLPASYLAQDLRLAGCCLPQLSEYSLSNLANEIWAFSSK